MAEFTNSRIYLAIISTILSLKEIQSSLQFILNFDISLMAFLARMRDHRPCGQTLFL